MIWLAAGASFWLLPLVMSARRGAPCDRAGPSLPLLGYDGLAFTLVAIMILYAGPSPA